MENISQLTMFANTDVLKEPRGFIKFIQIILAIFAFATCTAYNSSTSYEVKCNSSEPLKYTIEFSYPFRLEESKIHVNVCSDLTGTEKNIYGDYTAPSQFYVFVGVTAFLYSLGIVIFYVFGDDKYHNIETIPVVDFIVHVIYALLWLISSAVWAGGVDKIKHYVDPNDYFSPEYICECSDKTPSTDNCPRATDCKVTDGGNFATANVSIIFGFLCMCVWIGNLWFLYKETKWHKSANMPAMPQQSTPGSEGQKQQI